MNAPRANARAVAGAGIFALTLLVLAMIFFKPELVENDLFKMLAQAIVIQGLIGLAMAHYFTANSSQQQNVHVVNPPDEPVPVERADVLDTLKET